ncbi:WYL domain-containing protein [Gammaproteobacteria bacterium]|nr:WYL domain-containing protein [Gammaproteobacteria bacterium]
MANKKRSLDNWNKSGKHFLKDSDDPQVQRLIDAASDGELLEITYDGGSQPGSSREILPKEVFFVPNFGHYVSAHDYRRQEERTFRLSRLRVLDDIKGVPAPIDQHSFVEPEISVPAANSQVRSTPVEPKRQSAPIYKQPSVEPGFAVPAANSQVRSTPVEPKRQSTSIWFLIVGVTLLTIIISQQ